MKVTIASQLRVVSSYLIFVIGATSYLLYEYGVDTLMLRILGMSVIILGVPTLLLHMGYYDENKDIEVFIDENAVTLHKKSQTHIYTAEQIKNIEISKSAAMDKGGIPLTPFEQYFYVRLNLNDGKYIYLTSMLDKNIDEKIKVLKGVEFIREKSLFSFI